MHYLINGHELYDIHDNNFFNIRKICYKMNISCRRVTNLNCFIGTLET